ncbi:MAG: hypothetical protein RLZZ468_1451, partial [Cyanobacteriota bacterium]
CLLIQGTLVGGGQLVHHWTSSDPPCCVLPQAL